MRLEKIILVAILTVILMGLTACREVVPADPQVRLEERINGFIQARQARDQIALQAFYLNPHEARIGNIIYKKSKVASIDYGEDGHKAVVKLKNTMQAMGFTFKDTPQTIHWVWQNNDWYLLANSSTNPFSKPTNKSKKSTQKDVEK